MLKLGFEILLKKYICKHIKFRMKNAHFKTCNNLIFANIHRWYETHTTKKVNEVALRSWNKSFTVAKGFSSPRKSWEPGTMESHESHMAKAVRGRTTHSTCANSLPKDSQIKGKHNLHFSCFKVIDIAMQHFKEWWWLWIHGKHCTPRLLKLEEKTTKQNNPKPKPQQAPWGPGCLWKCSQAWPF